jgi:hypothetical protein
VHEHLLAVGAHDDDKEVAAPPPPRLCSSSRGDRSFRVPPRRAPRRSSSRGMTPTAAGAGQHVGR